MGTATENMPYVIENIRLKELALIAEQNKAMFDDFVAFLKSEGYGTLHAFVVEPDSGKARATLIRYFGRSLPSGVKLLDGIARPYSPDKAKWLLLGWIFRNAPEQRLRPILSGIPGNTVNERRARLYDQIRQHLAEILPEPERWKWSSISEVFIDRLEGSRRAIKGTLFEAIVRRHLKALFKKHNLPITVSDSEARIGGETYDVKVSGSNGEILMPVKTRETMGGGHALLFTRDIHKSISVAHDAGLECLPIIIAEAWTGDLSSLDCERFIYIDKNPNQIAEVEPLLAQELENCLNSFRSVM